MTHRPSAGGSSGFVWRDRVYVYGIVVFLIYIIIFVGAWWKRAWFLQPDGKPIAVDFLNFWAAGNLADAQHAPHLYDITGYKRLEVELIGHEFDGYYPWPYPPILLLLVAPLASMPYLVAWFTWIAAGLAFFVISLRLIVPLRLAVPLAVAAPSTLWCMAVGQNGFLTAGLFSCAVSLLGRRPWIAGIFVALLTYKPQFGIALPLFLIATRSVRAIVGAVATTFVLIGVSILAFGLETWRAFAESLGDAGMATLFHGADRSKLQSFYAILADATGDTTAAIVAHVVLCALLLVVMMWLWTRPVSAELKAAGLISASFLATPHAYIYDAVLLTVGVALLTRDGLARGFLPWDRALLFAAWLAPASFVVLDSLASPLGAALIVALALRRVASMLCPADGEGAFATSRFRDF